jgi:hypothetical protein
VIPAFVDRGGEHQTQEIPALLWALEHEYKMRNGGTDTS